MKAYYLCITGLFLLLQVDDGVVQVKASRPICENGQSLCGEASDQPYRTAYHFQPPNNWMNDPNGPMFYKGLYHLFYQYNPSGPLFGTIVWAHSVSYDLINWVHLEHALHHSETFDINGCWSGSITILPGQKPVILYTGIDFQNRQVQNLAVPRNLSDPLLREWVKSSHNPLMTPEGIDPTRFRDPSTAWQGADKIWRVIIGSEVGGQGTAILYQSKDFVKWSRSSTPLHFSNKTYMWECPDFYPVSVKDKNGVDTSVFGENTKHVLKASFNYHDYYIMGDYEPKTNSYQVDFDFMDNGRELRYDYGKYYASKSFFDSEKRRRILWSWVNESDSESDAIKKGWSGLQSIPRSVLIAENGKQLVQWPVEELEKLRDEEVSVHDTEVKGGSILEVKGITASQADVEVSFDLSNLNEAETIDTDLVDPQLLCSQKHSSVRGSIGPFGLLVLASDDLSEQTAVFFRVFKSGTKYVVLMCSDQSRSSLGEDLDKTTYGGFVDVDPRTEKISLRSLIDHSIVESFGSGGITCITARVYPKIAVHKDAHLYVFNNGTQSVKISKLSAWSMKPAQFLPFGKEESPF